MPEISFNIGHYGYGTFGGALNHCIKYNMRIGEIERVEYETVSEYETRTGKNYGCAPCEHPECKGARPGAFYYPNECPEFTNYQMEQDEEEYYESLENYFEDDYDDF